MPDKPQKQATVKAAKATFSINACLNCSQCIQLSFDGESVSCCCVRGRHPFSFPVTYTNIYIYITNVKKVQKQVRDERNIEANKRLKCY